MKRNPIILIMLAIALSASAQTGQSKSDYTYSNVPFNKVSFTDKFWAQRIETSRKITVPYCLKKCEETGRINNFAVAGGLKEGIFSTPYPFDDSDVYKIMEGASYLLAVKKDPQLDAYLDSLIFLIGKAQEPDGYLYTNRTISNPLHPWAGKARWVNERDNSHELYNAGHMYEAAVAHFQATGKRTFLDIAIKNANLLCATFGPEPGKITVAPGHEEVELALVKLYRATNDIRYLNLSKFFLDARGKYDKYDKKSTDQFRNGAYWQDHLPVVEQTEAVGHAVRAPYMYSAMADIAALKQDPAYLAAIDKLWNNVVSKKIYITGGIGSTQHGEAFGKNYELPNATAYCETCAAIANCMWNQRMFMLHGDSKYIDVLERSLYNGVLSGISLSGDRFFYPNPLEVNKQGQARSPWFDCSCCPSNLSRFIPSVPGYVYATDDKSIYVNLFVGSTAIIPFKNKDVKIEQQTDYPWNGNITMTVDPGNTKKFNLKIRIPGWCQNEVIPSDLYSFTNVNRHPVKIMVNGKQYNYTTEKGYAVVEKEWQKGDKIDISLPMTARTVKANELVEADKDRLSVEYGPIVYCAEFADNEGLVSNRIIAPDAHFSVKYKPDLLRGTNILKGKSTFYLTTDNSKNIAEEQGEIVLIPYALRSHRGAGEMNVWIADNPAIVKNKYLEAYRIVDAVIVANPESEKAHNLKGDKTNSGGSASGWRDASDGGWFSYDMKLPNNEPVQLVLTYYSNDGGNRFFEIFADDVKIGEQKLRAETFTAFIDRTYLIPENITRGKDKITIKIQSVPGNIAGGIFGCKIQRVEK